MKRRGFFGVLAGAVLAPWVGWPTTAVTKPKWVFKEVFAHDINVPEVFSSWRNLSDVTHTGLEINLIGGATFQQVKFRFPIRLTMPCRHVYIYRALEDVPRVTTPCRCGNPKHFEVQVT